MKFFLFRRSRWQRRISIAFGLYSAVLTIAYLAYLLANRSYIADSSVNFGLFISAIAFSALGTLLAYYRPENVISWLLVVVAFMMQTGYFDGAASIALAMGAEPTFGLLFWLNLFGWTIGITSSMMAFTFVLFPTARLPSPRWRPVVWLLGLQALLTIIFALILSIDAFIAVSRANASGSELTLVPLSQGGVFGSPIHVRAFPEMVTFNFALLFIASTLVAVAFWSQISRFRRAGRVERYQIKWVLYVLALWAFFVALAVIQVLIPELVPKPILGVVSSVARVLLTPLIPISIAIAILRYRLYDIDIIINRTLVYGTLTVLLALLYYAIIALLQSLFSTVSRQNSPVVIVISTLIIAVVFNPLRRRIQDIIDRRFYRQKYDAAAVLEGFVAAARVETDLDALSAELLHAIDKTMQPASMSLWLNERTLPISESND